MEVREVVPGEYEVTLDDATHRVLVPAGVGVPGVEPEELSAHVVAILRERGTEIPDVVDVTLLLRTHPDLLDAVERRSDEV